MRSSSCFIGAVLARAEAVVPHCDTGEIVVRIELSMLVLPTVASLLWMDGVGTSVKVWIDAVVRHAITQRITVAMIRKHTGCRNTTPSHPPSMRLPLPAFIVHHIQIAPNHCRPRSLSLDLFLGELDLASFRRLVPFGDPDGHRLAFEGGRVDVDEGDDPGIGESREEDDSGGCRGVCRGTFLRIRPCAIGLRVSVRSDSPPTSAVRNSG